MAERRMFSLKVMNSGRFLRMPIDAQNLYFHLALRADDDGVVEAYPVMRLIGSSEDNLKVLNAKGFIKVLNEDLVTYITDWLEHNKIRSDRKIDSIYKGLLLQVIPDIKLLEPTQRADRQPKDSHGTSHGQPKDGIGKDRIGKDRLSKDSKKDKPKKHKYGEYKNILLTDNEYEKLKDKVDNREYWIRVVDEGIELKGYSYKSHYLAILKWYKNNKSSTAKDLDFNTDAIIGGIM